MNRVQKGRQFINFVLGGDGVRCANGDIEICRKVDYIKCSQCECLGFGGFSSVTVRCLPAC